MNISLNKMAKLVRAARLALKYPEAYNALREANSKHPRIVLLNTRKWKKPREIGWSIVRNDMVRYEFGVRGIFGKTSLSWETDDYYAPHARHHLKNILKMNKYTKIYKMYTLAELQTLMGEGS